MPFRKISKRQYRKSKLKGGYKRKSKLKGGYKRKSKLLKRGSKRKSKLKGGSKRKSKLKGGVETLREQCIVTGTCTVVDSFTVKVNIIKKKEDLLGLSLNSELLVSEVVKDSVAEKAGVRIGQKLLKIKIFNEKRIYEEKVVSDRIELKSTFMSHADDTKPIIFEFQENTTAKEFNLKEPFGFTVRFNDGEVVVNAVAGNAYAAGVKEKMIIRTVNDETSGWENKESFEKWLQTKCEHKKMTQCFATPAPYDPKTTPPKKKKKLKSAKKSATKKRMAKAEPEADEDDADGNSGKFKFIMTTTPTNNSGKNNSGENTPLNYADMGDTAIDFNNIDVVYTATSLTAETINNANDTNNSEPIPFPPISKTIVQQKLVEAKKKILEDEGTPQDVEGLFLIREQGDPDIRENKPYTISVYRSAQGNDQVIHNRIYKDTDNQYYMPEAEAEPGQHKYHNSINDLIKYYTKNKVPGPYNIKLNKFIKGPSLSPPSPDVQVDGLTQYNFSPPYDDNDFKFEKREYEWIVTDVIPGRNAAKAGVTKGMVLKFINQQNVNGLLSKDNIITLLDTDQHSCKVIFSKTAFNDAVKVKIVQIYGDVEETNTDEEEVVGDDDGAMNELSDLELNMFRRELGGESVVNDLSGFEEQRIMDRGRAVVAKDASSHESGDVVHSDNNSKKFTVHKSRDQKLGMSIRRSDGWIMHVNPNDAASAAGIMEGRFIIKFDGDDWNNDTLNKIRTKGDGQYDFVIKQPYVEPGTVEHTESGVETGNVVYGFDKSAASSTPDPGFTSDISDVYTEVDKGSSKSIVYGFGNSLDKSAANSTPDPGFTSDISEVYSQVDKKSSKSIAPELLPKIPSRKLKPLHL